MRLILDERDKPWTLVIELWALAFDVSTGARVHIKLFDDDDHFYLEVADKGTFLAFECPKFQVTVGGVQHDYDFGVRPLMFGDAWKATPP